MPYAIEPVSVADAVGLSKTMMSAMHRDPYWALLFGSMPLQEIINDCTQRLPKALSSSRDERRHQKVVDQKTGEIVGYARWLLPMKVVSAEKSITWLDAQVSEPDPEAKKEYDRAFEAVTTPEGRIRGMNYEMASTLGHVLEKEEETLMKDGHYLTLDYLTTAPQHQGKGIATMLLKSGLAQADAAGLKTFVMSTPAGLKVYEKNGFESVRTVIHNDSKWGGKGPHVSTFLIRQPASVSRP